MRQTNIINNKIIRENELVEAFDAETIKRLLKSEEDIEKGRTIKAAELMKEIKEKYGFQR